MHIIFYKSCLLAFLVFCQYHYLIFLLVKFLIFFFYIHCVPMLLDKCDTTRAPSELFLRLQILLRLTLLNMVVPLYSVVDGVGVVGASPYGCLVLPDSGNTCSGFASTGHSENHSIPWQTFVTTYVTAQVTFDDCHHCCICLGPL